MNAFPQRRHWRLALLTAGYAIATIVLAGVLYLFAAGGDIIYAGSIGLAALGAIAVVVLAVQGGQSAGRLIAIVAISAFLLLPSLRISTRHAAAMLGLPFDPNPWSAWKYGSAYLRGKRDAQRDIAAGVLAVETFGLGAGGRHVQLLRERFGVDTRIVAGCMVDDEILGHAAGYNKIAEPEIDRRFGRAALEATREEGAKLDREAYEQQKLAERHLARRLSSFGAEHHVVLTSLSLYPYDALEQGRVAEQELARIVHAVEAYVGAIVPADVSAFELSVHGMLTPDAPPEVGTRGDGALPQDVYMQLYERVKALPDVRSTGGHVTYDMNFARRNRATDVPIAASH